jgi:hypothetical protein
MSNWQFKKIEEEGGIVTLCEGRIFALREDYYDEHIGLQSDLYRKENNECSILIM